MAAQPRPRDAAAVVEVRCRIASSGDGAEPCVEGACPFWEHGTAEAGCALERLQLELDRPDIAAYLLDMRRALDAARTVRARDEARRLQSALWPPELSGR